MEPHYPPKPPIETIKVKRYVLYVSKTQNSTSDVNDPKYFDDYREAFNALLHKLTYWLSPFRNDDDPWPVMKAEDWADVSDDFEDAIIAWQVWDEDAKHNILLSIYEEEHEYKIDTRIK
jgi:hypothetical protein